MLDFLLIDLCNERPMLNVALLHKINTFISLENMRTYKALVYIVYIKSILKCWSILLT